MFRSFFTAAAPIRASFSASAPVLMLAAPSVSSPPTRHAATEDGTVYESSVAMHKAEQRPASHTAAQPINPFLPSSNATTRNAATSPTQQQEATPARSSSITHGTATMTKAKRIRLAAAAAAAQGEFNATKSPAQFAILGQELRTLRDEEKLLSASLARLRAERALAQVREGFETVKNNFTVGMQKRERAALTGAAVTDGFAATTSSVVTASSWMAKPSSAAVEVSDGMASPLRSAATATSTSTPDFTAYQAEVLYTPAGHVSKSAGMTPKMVDGLHAETMKGLVAGELLGLPATADAEAAEVVAGKSTTGTSSGISVKPTTAKRATRTATPAKKKIAAAAAARASKKASPAQQKASAVRKTARRTSTGKTNAAAAITGKRKARVSLKAKASARKTKAAAKGSKSAAAKAAKPTKTPAPAAKERAVSTRKSKASANKKK